MKSLQTQGLAFLAMLLGVFGMVQHATAKPFLFSANPRDFTVTRIDLATGQSMVIMDASDGLTGPVELTVDRFGNLYVANLSSPPILRLSKDGQITVFVSGHGMLSSPHGLAFGPQGDLFIADGTTIYRFDASGGSLTFFADVTFVDQAFNILEDIEFDPNGNLYAASGDTGQGLGAIVKFDSEGNASVFATGLENPRDLAVDGRGQLYVANRVGEVVNRLDLSTGSVQLFADLSQAAGDPRGVETDLENNVYVLNSSGDIRKWNLDGTGGNIEFQSGSSFSEALAFSSGGLEEPDNDGDGVPNDEDECARSNLSATVVIEGCNAGVPNTLFTSGCTISDVIAACAEGARNHGQFVSCVSPLTNNLQKAGTITGQQKGAIQSCAAGAKIR